MSTLPANTVCALSGSAGESIACPLEVVATSADSPLVSGLQFNLVWDAAVVKIDNLYDNICFAGAGCFDLPMIAESNCLSTGHCISAAPQAPGDWDGTAGMIFVHLSEPWTPVSEAFFAADGSGSGEPRGVTIQAELLADVTGEPSAMTIDDITAASQQDLGDGGAVYTLDASMQDGRIVSGEPQ